jgi:hypothetical protein
VFPSDAETVDLYERSGFRVDASVRDGIVLRITGTRVCSPVTTTALAERAITS